MVLQYLRQVSLVVGDESNQGLDLSQLRIRFRVSLDTTQTLNYLEARVFNVSQATYTKIASEFTRVRLQAGYQGNVGTLFDGSIIQSRQGRDDATSTYVGIVARDGDKAYISSTVNATLGAGSTLHDELRVAQRSMEPLGVTMGQSDLPKDMPPSPRGRVMYGMSRDYLAHIAGNTGRDWSIQGGQLQFVSQTAYLPGQAVVLSPETGLVGIPENTQDGISLRCLLNPAIKPGKAIKLDRSLINTSQFSADIAAQNQFTPLSPSGSYKAVRVEHSGDTRGNDYYTDVVCWAIDASAPVSTSILGVVPDVF